MNQCLLPLWMLNFKSNRVAYFRFEIDILNHVYSIGRIFKFKIILSISNKKRKYLYKKAASKLPLV